MNSGWAIVSNCDSVFVEFRLTASVKLRHSGNSRMREDQLTNIFEVVTRDRDLDLRPHSAAHRHRGKKSRKRQANRLSMKGRGEKNDPNPDGSAHESGK